MRNNRMNKTNIIIGILLISVIFMVILGFAYSQTVIKIYITDTYYDINNDKILVINIEHPKYLTLFNENIAYEDIYRYRKPKRNT